MDVRTINVEDVIFATVLRNGMKIASMTLSGLSSIADLVVAVGRRLGRQAGLVTLCVRNYTKGWSDTRAVLMRGVVTG